MLQDMRAELGCPMSTTGSRERHIVDRHCGDDKGTLQSREDCGESHVATIGIVTYKSVVADSDSCEALYCHEAQGRGTPTAQVVDQRRAIRRHRTSRRD